MSPTMFISLRDPQTLSESLLRCLILNHIPMSFREMMMLRTVEMVMRSRWRGCKRKKLGGVDAEVMSGSIETPVEPH